MEQPKQLYILHGYNSSASAHWFAWLKQQMQQEGFLTKSMSFPNSSQPEVAAWLDYLAENIPAIDGNTFFVAHSLGCVTLLRYLQQRAHPSKLGGYILVSGFHWQMSNLRSIPAFATIDVTTEQNLADFSNFKADYAYLSAVSKNRVVIAAEDDYILPYELNLSQDLAKNLRAEFHSIKTGGHFLAGDGFESFPLIQQLLSDWT